MMNMEQMHSIILKLLGWLHFCYHSETGGGYELTPIFPTVVCPFIHLAVRLLYAV